MTGMFKWTNYWDYIIYLTVLILGMGTIAVRNICRGRAPLKTQTILFAGRIILIVLIGKLAALPFTSTFRMMVSEVAIAHDHTAFYQMLVLWGRPAAVLVVYVVYLFQTCRISSLFFISKKGTASVRPEKPDRPRELGQLKDLDQHAESSRISYEEPKKQDRLSPSVPQLTALLLGVCALGLILIPELVSVRDIYENGFSRSNTMFKLTYQAYLMFALFMGYALTEMLAGMKKFARPVHLASGVLLAILLLTMGYFPYSVKCWFGDVTDSSGFQGLDATQFIDRDYPGDAEAIRWLNENVSGNPIALEAYGDSYSAHCRVSAMTGLPTLEGWYVHEWLWRENVDALNDRIDEINAIFRTGDDTSRAKELLRKYNVSYIFVGSCEREQFPEMNEAALRSLGTVVFETEPDIPDGAYIIRVN